MGQSKTFLRALAGEALSPPPVWLMRQAGRYLPEYRATRAKAGDFLSLCYNSDLATEVTLQPIRRFGFDASILFADILLVPQALGAELWFVTGEGPRLSPIATASAVANLRTTDDIHETLAPIYQTVRNLRGALPPETTLIGFAGAPWTVATYMIAGRGTPDQGPARALMTKSPEVFEPLLDRVTEATIAYLLAQAEAGAEVIKIFDSWAGALQGDAFDRYVTAPTHRIVQALRHLYPSLPIIGFPRGATPDQIESFTRATGVDCIALGTDVDRGWAAQVLQPLACVQGNLDPALMVSGGAALTDATRQITADLVGGPHVFNLGHGITPDADPQNVHRMLDALRG